MISINQNPISTALPSGIPSGSAAGISTGQPGSLPQLTGGQTDRLLAEGAELTAPGNDPELREAFDDFVGQTFYSLMLKELRQTVGKSPYFNGGRAEEVFQGQLDQVIAEKLSDSNASSFTGPMFDLFQLPRQ
jgi:flagellar protein FlgJ